MVYCRNQNYLETGFDFDSNSSYLNNLDDFDWTSDYAAVHRPYDRSETVVSPHCCHIERMYLGCYRPSGMSALKIATMIRIGQPRPLSGLVVAPARF